MNVPLSIPDIGDKEINEVVKVLKSGWLAHGPKTKEFEELFANYIGTKNATSLNSCASALQLVIEGLDMRGEIILPSLTMSASANAVVRGGVKPVFVDIDPDTFNMDVSKIEDKITSKTHAIMPVHFAGLCCNMREILEISERANLYVIEDAAEALGADINGHKAGSFGIGCFSFYPTKNITTGEGGMITTNNFELKRKIDALKSHGIAKSTHERASSKMPWERDAIYAGYNFRMCDILAAIGIAQMEKLETMNALRIEKAKYYKKCLTDIPHISFQKIDAGYKHVYQMFIIKINSKRFDRDAIILKLREKGISASVHFDPPVHLQTFYRENSTYERDDLRVTEDICKSLITLPLYPMLEESKIDYITDNLRTILK